MMWLLLHRGYYRGCYYTVATIRMTIITVAIIIPWTVAIVTPFLLLMWPLCCGHYYCGYYSCGYYGMDHGRVIIANNRDLMTVTTTRVLQKYLHVFVQKEIKN